MALSLPDVERNLSLALSREPLFAPHASTAFEIVETLGQGGMGTVYAVRDRRNGRLAALKLLQRGETEGLDQARFLREALLTSRLNHPGIPPVHELGQTARGELFLLMRRIEGRTLEAEIAEFPKKGVSEGELRRLVQALVKVGEALCYAHSQGVIHRDVKPSNIMLGRYGEVLLLDWGVAKDQRNASSEGLLPEAISRSKLEGAGLTLAGALVGTPGYMAPEQARGEDVDERADVYALGLVLGEVLSGRPLVGEGNALARLIANCEGRFSPPDSKADGALAWIVTECLRPEKENRTESVDQLVRELNHWLNDDLIPGRRCGARERALRLVRRWPTASLSLSLGLAATFLISASLKLREEAEAHSAELARAAEASQRAEQESARIQRSLVLLSSAQALAKRGQVDAARIKTREALESARRTEATLLNAADLYLQLGDLDASRSLLKEALKSSRSPEAALWRLFDLEIEEGSGRAGTGLIEELAAQVPERATELAELLSAMRCQLDGDLAGALRASSNLTRTHPDCAEYHYLLALAMTQGQDKLGALSALERCLSLKSEFVPALLLRAQTYEAAGELVSASLDLDSALRLRPNRADIWRQRAELRGQSGDLRGARSDFETAIRLSPEDPKLRMGRARVLLDSGDSRAAELELNAALELGMPPVEVHYQRGVLHEKAGRISVALGYYAQAIEAEPSHFAALLRRSEIRRRLGELQEGLRDVEAALRQRPAEAEALTGRGRLRLLLDQVKLAEEDFEAALGANPNQAQARLGRARCRMERKDFPLAILDLDLAMKLDESLWTGYIFRAQCRMELGDPRSALSDFEAALAHNPPGSERMRLVKVVEELRRRVAGESDR